MTFHNLNHSAFANKMLCSANKRFDNFVVLFLFTASRKNWEHEGRVKGCLDGMI